MVREILNRENPILRKHAELVRPEDFGSDKLKQIVADMSATMASQKDGIAIAAPQIGVPLQIFVISGSLLSLADATYTGGEDNLIFINPKIIKKSQETEELEEGCLSVRWYYGLVKRHRKVTIKAQNEKGEKIERGASGLLAQIFQHETDHLNGILFTDKAVDVWEMSPEDIEELQKKQ